MTTVTGSVLSPNGQMFVAAGADDLVYLWKVDNPSDPQLVNTLAGPTTQITQLAISPDGGALAVSTSGGHVWLFGVAIAAKASLIAKLMPRAGRSRRSHSARATRWSRPQGGTLTVWHFRPYSQAIAPARSPDRDHRRRVGVLRAAGLLQAAVRHAHGIDGGHAGYP